MNAPLGVGVISPGPVNQAIHLGMLATLTDRLQVLDTPPLGDVASRPGVFRTVGWGHDALFWREFVTTLRRVGYDDVLSVEHEDAYLCIDEGLRPVVTFLRAILLCEPAPIPWWT